MFTNFKATANKTLSAISKNYQDAYTRVRNAANRYTRRQQRPQQTSQNDEFVIQPNCIEKCNNEFPGGKDGYKNANDLMVAAYDSCKESCTTNAVENHVITLNELKERYRQKISETDYHVSIPKGFYVVELSDSTFIDEQFTKIFVIKDPKIVDWGSDGNYFQGKRYRRKTTEQTDSQEGKPITVEDDVNIPSLTGNMEFIKFYKVRPDILEHLDTPDSWEEYKIGSGGRKRSKPRNKHRSRKSTRRIRRYSRRY
jgi:hypothetical protein